MTENFSRQEKKLIAGISFLMGLRMMGTSLIIPVFSIFAINLAGASDILAGIAVGFSVSRRFSSSFPWRSQ